MITIRKIAALAGVSRATVDRVVNSRGGVNENVERRIQKIINEYGYKPNKVARALASKNQSLTIGVISPSIENKFFEEVVRGIRTAEKEIFDFGISLIYREVENFSIEDQLKYIDEMMLNNIDALAINPINDPLIASKLQELNKKNIPIITFNSDIDNIEKLTYIGCDYEKSGRTAAGLIGLVCSKKANVAIVMGSRKILGHSLRINGFVNALQDEYPDIKIMEIIEMNDDEKISYQKVKQLIAQNKDLDTLFFAASGIGGGVRAVLEAGMQEKIRIVSVDLQPSTIHYLKEGIIAATICQDPYSQGYEAVRQLSNYILFQELPEKQIQYTQLDIIIKECLMPE